MHKRPMKAIRIPTVLHERAEAFAQALNALSAEKWPAAVLAVAQRDGRGPVANLSIAKVAEVLLELGSAKLKSQFKRPRGQAGHQNLRAGSVLMLLVGRYDIANAAVQQIIDDVAGGREGLRKVSSALLDRAFHDDEPLPDHALPDTRRIATTLGISMAAARARLRGTTPIAAHELVRLADALDLQLEPLTRAFAARRPS